MSNEKNFYLSERPDLVRRGRLAGRDPDRYRLCAAGYGIGMGAAIFTGEYDIAVIMVKAGLGIAALVILVFSTVTTTFLDAWSAGISAESLSAKLNGKKTAIAVTVIGTAAAILFPMDDITGFLYLIGSVFAPMIAVQIADNFILHRTALPRLPTRATLLSGSWALSPTAC